jgi:GT2 family glycosyltransferase
VLIESLESTPQAAMACPLILSENRRDRVWYAGGYITVFGNAHHKGMGKRWEGNPMSPEPVEYATSCALLIRREVFQRADGFNLELAGYSEDLELSIKVRRAGYGILFVPRARVYHGESRNVIKVAGKRFRDYYTMRNRIYIIKKYGSSFQKSIGVVVTIFYYCLFHGFIFTILGEWRRSRALFLGVADFFRNRMGWRPL